MRTFFATIGTILVIIILALVFIPFGLGFWLKAHFSELLSMSKPTQAISIEATNFQRGWFSSKVNISLKLNHNFIALSNSREQKLLNRFSYQSQQTIFQGPVIFVKTLDGNHKFFFAKAVLQFKINEPNKVGVVYVIDHWNHSFSTWVDVKHIQLAEDSHRFDIKGLLGQASISGKKFTSVKGQASLNQFSVGAILPGQSATSSPTPQIKVDKIQYQFNLNQSTESVWLGQAQAGFASFEYYEDGQHVSIKNVKFSEAMSSVKHQFNYKTQLHVDEIKGPEGFDIKPIDLKLDFKGIDGQALGRIITLLQQFNDATLNKQTVKEQMIIMKASQAMINLVGKGFTISMDRLKVGSPLGVVKAHGSVQVLPHNYVSISDLRTLINHVVVKLHVVMPESLFRGIMMVVAEKSGEVQAGQEENTIKQIDFNLKAWIANKMLILRDGQISVDVSWDKGQLLVNGHPPVQPFWQSLPSTPAEPSVPANHQAN